MQDCEGKPVKPDVIDNGDGTFRIVYTPKDVGHYTINIKFGGRLVPNAPFDVVTSPTGDASKCDIYGKCGSGLFHLFYIFGKLILCLFDLVYYCIVAGKVFSTNI